MTDKQYLAKLLEYSPYLDVIGGLGDYEIAALNLIANGVRLERKQATSEENKRWIPVSERLPEHGKVVLVCGKRGAIYTAWCNTLHKNPGWHKLNSKNHYCDPTHWMPLPTPPKEENND